MAVVTIYRLAEQINRILSGGDIPTATNVTIPELKIACGQVINQLLKTDYFQTNAALGEAIPNGSVLGLYEDITVTSSNGKSKATLPVKPLKLPRNMGVFAIYQKTNEQGYYDLDKEFIPLQMGQGGLVKSQPLLNDLMGQTGYEIFGNEVIFTKDLPAIYPYIRLAMRLVIMDINEYGDYDALPILPEMEAQVIQMVVEMYSKEPLPDKVVDSTNKEQKNVPLLNQRQA